MNWTNKVDGYSNGQAIRIVQWIWMAFAIFAIGCAIPGIPHYLSLLQTPCIDPGCMDFQLTYETAQAWVALGVKLANYASAKLVFQLLVDILLIATATFLIWRNAENRSSVIAAFVAVSVATSTLSQAQAIVDPRFWLPAQVILFVQMAGLLPLFCMLPDGRFQPDWLRWVSLAYILACVIYLSPSYSKWIAPGNPGNVLWTLFLSIALLVATVALSYRYRRSINSTQKEQIIWILVGISLAVLYILFSKLYRFPDFTLDPMAMFDLGPATEIINMFLAVGSFTCLLVALVNFEPLDVKILVNRTLVYLALTVFIIVAYGLIVGYLSTAFHSDNTFFSLIATGLIAIFFQPLSNWLRRGMNRLIYGDRDDPYQVLTRLGQRLETALEPSIGMETIVETIARVLKLPYAAIRVFRNQTNQTIAVFGEPKGLINKFPLLYYGEAIGELEVASYASEPLRPVDQRLLVDLTRQISVVAHANRLAADLQLARLQIVDAREEARRRLGSDLHDVIGHQLVALARRIEIVAPFIERDPTAARDQIREINQNLNTTITQVRVLSHQLHPPELELLGLTGALRERVQTLLTCTTYLDMPEYLPNIPAAIETTAYFITLEALTNIEKHASASECHLRLSILPPDPNHMNVLEIAITDDGVGFSSKTIEGLGLLSMQGRAIEVGGTCQLSSNVYEGTSVLVRLPFWMNDVRE
jgi:signal transduction histidine kinase